MKSGFVCHCPELRLYRYVVRDDTKSNSSEGEVDYKFDEDDLENTIASHLASGDEMNAKVMAAVTSLARLHPHKFVEFNEAGMDKIEVREPSDFWKEHDAKRDAELAEQSGGG